MPRQGVAVEIADELVTVPIAYRKPLPPGTRVSLRYLVEGGTWDEQEMTQGREGFSIELELPEDAAYEAFLRIQEPGKEERQVDLGTKRAVAAQEREAPASSSAPEAAAAKVGKRHLEAVPHPAGDVKERQRDVGQAVKNIFEGVSSLEAAKTLEARLRSAERVKELLGADFEPFALKAVAKQIRANRNFPDAVKQFFPEVDPPATFDELNGRLEEGSNAFREVVFEQLLLNPEARRIFKLEGDEVYQEDNPLGKDAWNKLFWSYCDARSGRAAAPAFRRLFEEHTADSPVDPEGSEERATLFDQVAARLPKEKKESLMKKVATSKLSGTADVLYNIGTAGLLLAAPYAGLAAMGAKVGAGLLGTNMKDVIELKRNGEVKAFLKKLLTNNAFIQPFLSKQGYWKAFGKRIGEAFGRALPGAGLYFAGASVGERKLFAEPGGAGEATTGKAPKSSQRDPATLIDSACRASLRSV